MGAVPGERTPIQPCLHAQCGCCSLSLLIAHCIRPSGMPDELLARADQLLAASNEGKLQLLPGASTLPPPRGIVPGKPWQAAGAMSAALSSKADSYRAQISKALERAATVAPPGSSSSRSGSASQRGAATRSDRSCGLPAPRLLAFTSPPRASRVSQGALPRTEGSSSAARPALFSWGGEDGGPSAHSTLVSGGTEAARAWGHSRDVYKLGRFDQVCNADPTAYSLQA